MQRNIYERVEVMFRLKDPALCTQVFTQVISPYLADTEKTRILMPAGDYVHSRKASRFAASRNGFRFNAQEFLIGFPEIHDDSQALPSLPRFVKLPKPHNPKKSPRERRPRSLRAKRASD